MISETIKPLGDRVIIKAHQAGNTKAKQGRILVEETATRGESTWGEVLLVGNGVYSIDGKLIPMSVQKGDLVLYKKDMVGDKITIEDVEYIMFREQDLLMVDSKTSIGWYPSKTKKELLTEEMGNDSSPMNTFKKEF